MEKGRTQPEAALRNMRSPVGKNRVSVKAFYRVVTDTQNHATLNLGSPLVETTEWNGADRLGRLPAYWLRSVL